MELAGLLQIFQKSVEDDGVWYTKLLGGRGFTGHLKLTQIKPYGASPTTSKLECGSNFRRV
jgi:hypothetical protein